MAHIINTIAGAVDLDELLSQNRARKEEAGRREEAYDPETGLGCCGERRPFDASRWGLGSTLLPAAMLADPEMTRVLTADEFRQLRFRHDFEYWAFTCLKIRHKISRRYVPMRLNAPQRRCLHLLENQRKAGKPLRIIVLKARQWGSSTFAAAYMLWWQLVLHQHADGAICTHTKDTAAVIKGTIDIMLRNYPPQFVNTPGDS